MLPSISHIRPDMFELTVKVTVRQVFTLRRPRDKCGLDLNCNIVCFERSLAWTAGS